MEPYTAVAAFASIVISAVLAITQIYKFIQDLRDRTKNSKKDATKAEAERDSIAVKTAEGSLLIMKGMLDVTRASESELRKRVIELEDSDRQKSKEIRELKDMLQERDKELHQEREEYAAAQKLFEERMRELAKHYEARLKELQQRVDVLEAKANGEETNPGG